jgi:hypothetical protein
LAFAAVRRLENHALSGSRSSRTTAAALRRVQLRYQLDSTRDGRDHELRDSRQRLYRERLLAVIDEDDADPPRKSAPIAGWTMPIPALSAQPERGRI